MTRPMTGPDAPRPGSGRGKQRDPAVHQRILEAALEEYAERGWQAFTLNGVARRAGVGKSTIYLRWTDKEALLTESLRTWTADLSVVDTGTLRGDLSLLGRNLLRYYLEPHGWASLRLFVDAASLSTNPSIFDDAVIVAHVETATLIFQRAEQRGESSGELPALALIESLYGGVTMSAITLPAELRHSLSDAEIDERVRPLVDVIERSVRPTS